MNKQGPPREAPWQFGKFPLLSIYLFHSWAGAVSSRGTIGAWHVIATLVEFHHDGIHDTFEVLLFPFEFVLFSKLILIEPLKGLLDGFFNLLSVTGLKLVLELLIVQRVLHRKTKIFQTVPCFDLLPMMLILGFELFCFGHHLVNLSL